MGTNSQVPNATYVWLTSEAGVFARNGVPVELRGMTGQAQTNAMVAGDLDAEVHAGVALVLSAAANGTPLKIVADMQRTYDLELVTPAAITSADQLRGRKVGSQTGTSGNAIATEHYLHQQGLEPGRDYQVVLTGSAGSESGMAAQLISHQVDAIAVSPAAAAPVIAQGGYHVLVDFAKSDVKAAGQILVFQAPYVQQHPDVVQRTVDSMIQGVRYFKEHKSEAEAMMRSRFKMTDQNAIDQLHQRQSEVLTDVPTVDKADFADVLSTMPKDGPQLSTDQLAAMLDNHFVEDAIRRKV